MRTIPFLLVALSACFGGHAVSQTPSGANEQSGGSSSRPNIIVFYTDDHGHADLGIHGVVKDLKTPHLDALARSGVVARHGYCTAPQCVPSRAGLLTGRFQARFGLESNDSALDGFNRQTTVARRLQEAGYVTAQFGKWHLGPNHEIPRHGFTHFFSQHSRAPFSANITLDGKDRPISDLPAAEYHIEGCSKAAAAVIERYHDEPFFLYIAYRAPHVPLDAPKKFLARFPGKMPERRRQALAMLSAVDDGVGLITHTLKRHGLSEKTLVFFIGDNGAPLKIHKEDEPGGGPGWDGSLNDPLNGEKGMLTEGGIHVPFVIAWPGKIPGGQNYQHPVSALDVAATAASVAGLPVKPNELDGANLVPHLTGEKPVPPHDFLAWRWAAQSAIREGNWKLLRGGEREYLYDLSTDLGEKHNLASQHPEVAARLRTRLRTWCGELDPPGLANGKMAPVWNQYFDHYLEGKTLPQPVRSSDKAGMGDLPPATRNRAAKRQTGVSSSPKPNVLFILADDLGWADTTLYGHTKLYRTPNLERLARRGMTFTRAYSASPLCSPTRSAILTGLSPARTGITSPTCHLPEVRLQATPGKSAPPTQHAIEPAMVTRLKTDYPTLPKALKAAGYATAHFGKWHLGPEPYSPLQHGFDVDIPHWPGPGPAGSFVAPWKFPDFKEKKPGEHIEDRMAAEAVAWMEKHQDQPFYLNYWQFSVHAPFNAKKELIEKYRPLVNPADPQRSPTYAAMIESFDDAIGTLLDALDRLQLADRTIIVFTSDNGGNMYNEVDGTTPTSNRPLRGGKASMFEGGTRIPQIIVWPGHTTPGTRSDFLTQSEDFFPTLQEGLALQSAPGQIFDGTSILPALKGGTHDRKPVFQFFPHGPGVPDWLPPSVSVHRSDGWKLIRIFHAGTNGAHRHLLFNLTEDLGEKTNLAPQRPDLVAELDALIEAFLADTKAVVPIPNPSFDPAKYRPELEGVQSIKNPGKKRPKRPARTN